MFDKDIESSAISVLLEYPVKRAALFGSAARGDMTKNSDIDMIIEFLPDSCGIRFFGLLVDLEKKCGRHVDLLTFEALEREAGVTFKENVKREMRVIYERKD
ncbi:MAG: nucleotidyltransferase domain-containing protein [Gracilibacteraceae bacterium]|jgi:predicted nucleotidyltransferase|nr:nucleotidyltransferase domain-containing protein [Gracilibacteraceae bacterium]